MPSAGSDLIRPVPPKSVAPATPTAAFYSSRETATTGQITMQLEVKSKDDQGSSSDTAGTNNAVVVVW
jgi:hypothetical protein